MITKLKKYFKIMICSALMFSLILPSYAALSATDGSSFITKSEFDSALADFNARLTTFEAGINSKIDSQVTTYLDRNGIWSGKQFVDADVEVFSSTLCTADDIKAKICGTSVDKTKKFMSFYCYTHDKAVGKSGMCVVKLLGNGKATFYPYKSSSPPTVANFLTTQLLIPYLQIRDHITGNVLYNYRVGQFFYIGKPQTAESNIRCCGTFNVAGADLIFFVNASNVLDIDFGVECSWKDTDTNGFSGMSVNSPWEFTMKMKKESCVY